MLVHMGMILYNEKAEFICRSPNISPNRSPLLCSLVNVLYGCIEGLKNYDVYTIV